MKNKEKQEKRRKEVDSIPVRPTLNAGFKVKKNCKICWGTGYAEYRHEPQGKYPAGWFLCRCVFLKQQEEKTDGSKETKD